MTNGGDAVTNQRNGLLNLKAANFGGNGGRAGQSTTGGATGGEFASPPSDSFLTLIRLSPS